MERETGIEPATNSLEGCDSTTELLPPFDPRRSLRASLRGHTSPPPQPARSKILPPHEPLPLERNLASCRRGAARSAACRQTNSATKPNSPLEPRAERLVGRGGFEPP